MRRLFWDHTEGLCVAEAFFLSSRFLRRSRRKSRSAAPATTAMATIWDAEESTPVFGPSIRGTSSSSMFSPELGGGVKGVDSSGISSGGVASQMRTHLTTDIVSWYSLPRDSGTPTSKVRLATALSERRPITMPCSVLGYRAVKPAESEVGCWCCGSPEAGPW